MEQKHAIGRSIVTFFPEMKDRNGETGYVSISLFSLVAYRYIDKYVDLSQHNSLKGQEVS